MGMLLRRHHKPKEAVKKPKKAKKEEAVYPLSLGGGGWFELSNGDRVQGEKNALKAQQALNE